MKKTIIIQLLLSVSLVAMAQKECKVLSQEVGSIRFEVDENLPKVETERQSFLTVKSENLARSLVSESLPFGYKPEILAYSFAGEKISASREDVFFHALVRAYAEHRPFVLSPDMVWQLIGFNFSEYVNNHAEEMRSLLVPHDGVKDLKIMTEEDILGDKNADWSDLFDKFSAEIAKNTKGDIAQLMTSDFSTTGQTERIASQITLMESLKSYFHYIAGRLACGIPYIILKGTPADWRKVAEKVQGLEAYNMGWWTKELKPIIAEFVKTAEGHPDSKFWKDIVMEDRPDRLRGGGCSMETPTNLDGWIVKLFPNMKKGEIRTTIPQTQMQGAELSEVKFKYQVLEPFTMKVLEETDIALYAGFVGVTIDEATGAIEPKIGWIARKVDEEGELLARLTSLTNDTKIKTVPEVLKREKHYNHLYLAFVDSVVIPEWMDSIDIKDFKIEGKMSEEQEAQLKQRFPKAVVLSAEKRKAARAKREAEEAKRKAEEEARKVQLTPIPAKYSQRLDSVVLYDDFGWVLTFVPDYDNEGNISSVTRYREDKWDRHGSRSSKTVTRYEAQGREVSEVLYRWNEGWVPTDTTFREVQHYYNDAHQLDSMIKASYYNGKDMPPSVQKTTYQYNRKGLLTEECIYRNGELEETVTYKYDGKKHLVRMLMVDEESGFEHLCLFTYDKQGRCVSYTSSYPNSLHSDIIKETCQYNLDGDKSMVFQMHYFGEGSKLSEDFPEGDLDRTTAFFYDEDTECSEVMGLEAWLKNNLNVLPCAGRFGVSKYKPTHIVIKEEGDGAPSISTFYYSSLP